MLAALAGPIVVILAAGQGSRMRSRVPKLLHPLCGRPIIGWPVATARAAGASKIVVVDAPGEPLREHLDEDVVTVVQGQARGTADAVLTARAHFSADAPVIVLAGDMPLITAETIVDLLSAQAAAGAAGTVLTAIVDDPSGYGRIVRRPDGSVERIVETKSSGDATPEQLQIGEISTSTFAFAGGTLAAALEQVGTDNAQGEYYLPDVLEILSGQGHPVSAHVIADPLQTLGVNDRRQLADVRAVAQRRIADRHMLAGVTIVDPATTVIDVDVRIEPDAVIAPFSCLHGQTAIGAESTVGPHATVTDSQIGAGTTILHSVIRESVVEDNVNIGPFASLRPGTVMRDRSKAGSFVELKNSDVGEGSKVPHLSYIGDTDIGEGSNLGASTITANYDGYRKHRTTIGSRVKTSVDTTIVAPVTVGDDAYTGAGSVITDDIPDGALGIARARQQNIDGYAERRRGRTEAERSEPAKHD